MVHLDTNFLVKALKPQSPEQARVLAWGASPTEDLGISAIAWAEFLCGPLPAHDEQKARGFFPNPEPLLAADAELAAELFNKTGRRSKTLADCMIAAVAMRCNAKLATANTADFQPFVPHGLSLA
jgi:predicted nucleic acid-binding protein